MPLVGWAPSIKHVHATTILVLIWLPFNNWQRRMCNAQPNALLSISLTADDLLLELYFDGTLVQTNQTDWTDVVSKTLPNNIKLVAVKCQNQDQSAGFLASTSDGLLLTDNSWKCTSQPQTADWTSVTFDDSSWSAAVIVSPNQSPDVHGTVSGINLNASWIWTADNGSAKDTTVYCRSPVLPKSKMIDGFTCFPWIGSCYLLVKQSISMINAGPVYSAENAHMAYVESADELVVIKRVLRDANVTLGGVSIGGCRTYMGQQTSRWTAACAEVGLNKDFAMYPMNYTNWTSTEPRQFIHICLCVVYIEAGSYYEWYDTNCIASNPYVIYETAMSNTTLGPTSIATSVRTSTSVNVDSTTTSTTRPTTAVGSTIQTKETSPNINGDKVTAGKMTAAIRKQTTTTAAISQRVDTTTVSDVATTTPISGNNNTTPHGPLQCVVDKCMKGGNCSSWSTKQTEAKYSCTSATGHCYVVYNLKKERAKYGCHPKPYGFNKTTYCPTQFAIRAKEHRCQFCCFGANMCNKQRYISDLEAMCAKVVYSSEASTLYYRHMLNVVLCLALVAVSM